MMRSIGFEEKAPLILCVKTRAQGKCDRGDLSEPDPSAYLSLSVSSNRIYFTVAATM